MSKLTKDELHTIVDVLRDGLQPMLMAEIERLVDDQFKRGIRQYLDGLTGEKIQCIVDEKIHQYGRIEVRYVVNGHEAI